MNNIIFFYTNYQNKEYEEIFIYDACCISFWTSLLK